MSRLSLSPSRIARFFFHECERYLRYHATPRGIRKEAGVPSIAWDQSPVTAAILEGGYTWEQEVIEKKLSGGVKIARGKGPLHERAHDVKETLRILPALKAGETIYQPTLKVPESFLSRYGIAPQLCEFPACRPDLVQLVEEDGGNCLRVIDVKASTALKASHRIQVTLYGLILRDVLQTHGLDLTLDLGKGGVWLHDQDDPEWFDLRLSISTVERFLRDQLPRVLTAPIEELSWHPFFRCEWCEFYDHCRKEAEETRSISLIPYLSTGGRKYLREAPWDGGSPVNTMAELESFLARTDADRALEACGSLRTRGDRLRNALDALNKGEVIYHGGASLALPVNEHVCLLLTLQDDPVTGRIYAAGFRRLKGKEVYGNGVHDEIFIAGTPEECEETRRQFISSLFEELNTLHAFNEKREEHARKSMQAYVYDGYELSLFNRMLLESLADPELARFTLQMLFHFQDTFLADADEHPDNEVPFPVIVLTGVIQQLLAMPIPLTLRLCEVCEALPSPTFKFKLEPSNLFWFELSNRVKSDAVFMAWNKGRSDAVNWIHDELLRRLRATGAVLDGLREKVKGRLFAWPPRFLFPGALDFKHPELSRLAFITRYESFMGAMEVRQGRSLPWSERAREGTSILLQKTGGGRWQVLTQVDSSVLAESGDFLSFLLVPDGDEGERAQMSYNDYRNRKAFWAPRGIVRLARMTNQEVNTRTGIITHLHLDLRKNSEQAEFDAGARAVLHPRFTDFNSDRVMDRLAVLDASPANDFLRLLRSPTGFARSASKFADLKNKALQVASARAGFTRSQLNTFRQVLDERLTLVWGPPGTGKTHFLAKTILTIARARKEAGKSLRVAVSAFTHAAIENLLAEIRDYVDGFGLRRALGLYKLKNIYTPRGRGLQVLQEKTASEAFGDDLVVMGGTVWSFHKAELDGEFPILIVDEASQMKLGEFSLGMAPLAARGHLVLAGDDLQLPPILKGIYPDPEDGLPGLHESIFAFLRARDDEDHPYTYQLKENWRMNSTLSLFPAGTLYGLDYQPATEAIARQKLQLRPIQGSKKKVKESALCDWLIDPDFPIAIAILEDIRATVENVLEAELVAKLAMHLRQHLLSTDGKSCYPLTERGDQDFWRHGLFIVSPHHAQIRAIKKELAKLREWQSEAFVDTVDKMQGQQSQSVIVSYGVSDVETAMAEAEFIYSLNRLNVSVSRARAKCIVFLPRPLIEPSFEVLQNEKAGKGLAHMHALIEFCRTHGEEREFSTGPIGNGGQGKLTALRACVP